MSCGVHFTPNALIVSKDSKFNCVDDLIKFAKEKPGAVIIGGSGTYSANHLETLRLAKLTGTKLTYIPHKGTGPPQARNTWWPPDSHHELLHALR